MLAIYGPGETTVALIERHKLAPRRFFSSRGGGVFLGLPIEPASHIDSSITQLIIASSHFPEILFGLIDSGFPIERIGILYDDGLDNVYDVDPRLILGRREEYEEAIAVAKKLREELPGNDSPSQTDRDAFRVQSVSLPAVPGLNLEFGTYRGESIRTFAPYVDKIFGFDTFSGLPEDWTPVRPKGSIDAGGVPEVPRNVELVVGKFEDTLEGFLADHLGPVRFAFIDCDLFGPTKYVLQMLDDRFIPGSVVLFDEFIPVPEELSPSEYRGWSEYLANSDRLFRFDARSGNAVRFVCSR